MPDCNFLIPGLFCAADQLISETQGYKRYQHLMKKLAFPFLAAVLSYSATAFAYDATGHALVGAIADARLAGTPAGAEVSSLIDGITLERAAVLPDEIKSWDRNGPDVPGLVYLPDHPEIERQLREFWRANPPLKTPRSGDDSDPVPSHHWFHYTDIPILGHTRYDQGTHGRSKWDIVHMIPYCVDVLRGKISEDNPRKITKPVAVILLAHYVGDIHQPLHVTADYFDRRGNSIDPDALGVQDALEDQGGNTLTLDLKKPIDPENPRRRVSLHGFWDHNCPAAVIVQIGAEISRENPNHPPEFSPAEIAARLGTREPAGWNAAATADPAKWAEIWANEIIPIGREAHARLQYSGIKPEEKYGVVVAVGTAREKSSLDGKSYADWSRDVVANEIAKAGWRLAALLETSLKKPD
jgi:hypothetical protein